MTVITSRSVGDGSDELDTELDSYDEVSHNVSTAPLLFIFYVDDISEVKIKKKFCMLMISSCYMHNVTAEDNFEETQQDIGSWIACGKLSFNESKTVWMRMSRKHHLHFTSVDLHLNRKKII